MTLESESSASAEGGMYEERTLDSPAIQCVWQALAVRDEQYLVPAVEYWDLWFTRGPDGALTAGLAGPALGHRWIRSAVGEHGWGVQLRAHVTVPGVSKRLVLGGEQRLPIEGDRLRIADRLVPFPEFDRLEAFIGLLLELEVLRIDEDVQRVLSGDDSGYSGRHWQRRVREATGLTRKQIAQLERAREAFGLLLQGVSPADCAAQCGFADQAHLTRTLGAFHGQTPARILAGR